MGNETFYWGGLNSYFTIKSVSNDCLLLNAAM